MPTDPPPVTPDPPAEAERWGVLVRVEPGDIPGAVRVKQWLKSGKRRWGLVVEDLSSDVPVKVVYVERPKPKRTRKVKAGEGTV